MRSKILGYVVVGPQGCYLAAADSSEDDPTLWTGSTCTLFATSKAANEILQRTRRYADVHGYSWPWFKHSFVKAVRAYA